MLQNLRSVHEKLNLTMIFCKTTQNLELTKTECRFNSIYAVEIKGYIHVLWVENDTGLFHGSKIEGARMESSLRNGR